MIKTHILEIQSFDFLSWILINLPSGHSPGQPFWRLYIQEINKAKKLAKEKDENANEEQQSSRRPVPRRVRKRKAVAEDPEQPAEEPERDPPAPAPKRRFRSKASGA